jgi:hypothetical protein
VVNAEKNLKIKTKRKSENENSHSTCFFAQIAKEPSVLNFRTLNLKNDPAT